jgi:hypothetical protein
VVILWCGVTGLYGVLQFWRESKTKKEDYKAYLIMPLGRPF